MSCEYEIPVSLLRFLGACIYGNPERFYAGLDEAGRAELEEQGRNFGMTAWFYRYLCGVLPEEKRAEYRTVYQTRQINAMRDAQELQRLYRVLAEHALRFVPVKGADLAYRLYPDAALRAFGDWDIWFHPDDCGRALAVLAEDGWNVSEQYVDEHGNPAKSSKHHFAPFCRGRHMVEPHFTLANFEGIDPYGLWEHTVEYPGGIGQRILSPEMNLLMLTRHAASTSYHHVRIPKLLTDAAMVMRENVGFDKLRGMAARWHLPYPGDLLAAFPEFFPAELVDSFGADPEKKAVFRKLFELRAKIIANDESFALSRLEARGQIVRGVLNHIRSLSPGKIRLIYHLPKQGAWGRVAWSYVHWILTRSWRATEWFRKKSKLLSYAELVELVESAFSTPSTRDAGSKGERQ